MSTLIQGSEEGWKAASDPKNPRYAEKQQDIKKFVDRYKTKQDERKAAFEKNMEEDYFEGALAVANAMQGNVSFGYSHIPQEKWDAIWEN